MVSKQLSFGRIHLARPQCIGGDIVFIDGMSCSGKSLLAPLISTADRCELWQINYMYDFVCILDHLRLIDPSSAAGIVRTLCDLDVYNSMVARGINFRSTDLSGVAENLLDEKYRARLTVPDGDIVVDRIQKEKTILPLMVHYSFSQSRVLFDALQDRLKMYAITVRHPLWLLDSWHKARWDKRDGKDPRHFRICCRVGKKTVPWFAASWAREYLDLSPIDRSVKVVSYFIDAFQKRWESCSAHEKKRIELIPFEKFSVRPLYYLDRIARRLGAKKTCLTQRMLKKLRLPRNFKADEIDQKRFEIEALLRKERCSKRSAELIEVMSVIYENQYLRT